MNRFLKNIESKLGNIGSNVLNYIQAVEEDYRKWMETPTPCCHCQEIYLYQDLLPTWAASLGQGSDRVLYRQVWGQPWPGERISPHSHCRICWEPIYEENKRIVGATRQEQIRQERLVIRYRREANAVKRHNERAIEAGSQATLTITQWIETLNYYDWRCAYCGTLYEELEHRIPIALGGGTTAINCIPSCRPCNRTKSMRHPDKIIETSLSPEAHRRINTQMEALHGKHSQELLAENLTPLSD